MNGRVLVVGEILADMAETSGVGGVVPGAPLGLAARPGGSPANVAVGLARLGVVIEFAGRLSGSGLGPWLRRHLDDNGVGTSLCVTAGELPTLAFVGLDPSGVPAYAFYGADTSDWQWQAGELPDPDASGIAAVHTGSLACALPPGSAVIADWLDRARAGGDVLVSYDPNVRPTLIPDLPAFAAGIGSWIARSHLVKVSEEDITVLFPHRPVMDVAIEWAAAGPDLVVVTHGERGATAVRSDGSQLTRPGRPVRVVDTVGAGDSFASGLLAWLSDAGVLRPGGLSQLPDDELSAAIDRAITTSAITCTRAGADPPGPEEIAAFAG